jgi:aryl-alcohol dehydrogenase-like predicted oxidoreductase
MRTAQLGFNGPRITRVGFGAWAVGGAWKFGWGSSDDEQSVAAIRHAVELGINWIDTAAVYGLGHSEEVVGRAVEPFAVGDEVLVFTKCGRTWYHDPTGDDIQNNLRPEHIRFECEQSLKRLGIERIDLYQFHWPDRSTGTQIEDSWSAMQGLVQEGKVRWAGVSNFTIELLERAETIANVQSLQPPLSLINRASADDVIPWCKQHDTGVIVYSPMASGLLTGTFDADRVRSLSPDDWRSDHPNFTEPNLTRTLALVDRLRPIAAEAGCSVAELAIAWTLSVPGVTGAIVGARRPDQVDDWAGAADIELTPEVLAAIAGEIEPFE